MKDKKTPTKKRKADVLAGKGSVAGKVKKNRQRKQSRLGDIMGGRG